MGAKRASTGAAVFEYFVEKLMEFSVNAMIAIDTIV